MGCILFFKDATAIFMDFSDSQELMHPLKSSKTARPEETGGFCHRHQGQQVTRAAPVQLEPEPSLMLMLLSSPPPHLRFFYTKQMKLVSVPLPALPFISTTFPPCFETFPNFLKAKNLGGFPCCQTSGHKSLCSYFAHHGNTMPPPARLS